MKNPEDYGQELEWNYGRNEKHIHEFVCKEPDIDGLNRGICACGATIIGETFSDAFKN